MPLNKLAPWGAVPAAQPPAVGLATVVKQNLSVIAGQAPLAPQIDLLRQAVSAADPRAAINALAATLAPLANLPQAIADASDVSKLGFQAVAAEIDKLNKSVQSGPGAVVTPSVDAYTIVAALGQARDALCDQKHPTLAHTNDLLAKAAKSASVQAARASLAALPDFVAALDRQLAPLDDRQDFETQRRQRLAQLVAFEVKVLTTIGL
jgi:hypothetical protein